MEISPPRGWWNLRIRETWAFRGFIAALAIRDIRLRFRQSLLGVAWTVAKPLGGTIAFAVLFEFLGKAPSSGNAPFVVSLLAGFVPWQLFSAIVAEATISVVAQQGLIRKVYFPALALPLVPVVPRLFDFAIGSLALFAAMIVMGVHLSWSALLVPLIGLGISVFAIGLGLWLAAFNALYRDIGHAVPFGLQLYMFLSPVVYEAGALLPPRFLSVLEWNPLVALIGSLRACLLNAAPVTNEVWLKAFVTTTITLCAGILVFHRVERHFADRV